MSGKQSTIGGAGAFIILAAVFVMIRRIDFDEQPTPSPYYQHSEEGKRDLQQRVIREIMPKNDEEFREQFRKMEESQNAESSGSTVTESPQGQTETTSKNPAENGP